MPDTATFSQLIILASSLFLAGNSYRLSEKLNNTALMVISLAAAFISCSAAAALLLSSADQDSITFRRMLDNLALYASIPLIASALLDLAHKFDWSKAAWGRWLLVLFALFELCRRSEVGTEYSQLMSLLCAAVVIYSAIRFRSAAMGIIGSSAGIILGTSLLIFSDISLLPGASNDLFYSLGLSLFLILIALSLKGLNRTRV